MGKWGTASRRRIDKNDAEVEDSADPAPEGLAW